MGKSRKTEIDIDEIAPLEEEEEEKEEDEKEEEPEEETVSRSFSLTRKNIILIAITFLTIIAIGIGITFYFIIGIEPSPQKSTTTEIAPVTKLDNYLLGRFFFPLQNSSGKKEDIFLKLTIEIKAENQETMKEIKDNVVLLRKKIYDLIKNKKKDLLETKDEQEKLNKKILNSLNKSLKSGKIEKIYFTEFFIM